MGNMRPKGQMSFFPKKDVPRLQPHQATPDQFRRLPGLLWHGNYSENGPDRDSMTPVDFDPPSGTYQSGGVHAGSRRAAMDALDMHGPYHPNKAIDDGDSYAEDEAQTIIAERGGRHGYLHPILPDASRIAKGDNFDEGEDWAPALARVNPRLRRDMEADGDRAVEEAFIPKGLRYSNTTEHPGSTSTLIPTSSPMTQEDYVRQAIQDGRAHEVHPLTMDLFKRGLLTESQAVKYQPIGSSGATLGSEFKRSARTARVRASRRREELKGQQFIGEES